MFTQLGESCQVSFFRFLLISINNELLWTKIPIVLHKVKWYNYNRVSHQNNKNLIFHEWNSRFAVVNPSEASRSQEVLFQVTQTLGQFLNKIYHMLFFKYLWFVSWKNFEKKCLWWHRHLFIINKGQTIRYTSTKSIHRLKKYFILLKTATVGIAFCVKPNKSFGFMEIILMW